VPAYSWSAGGNPYVWTELLASLKRRGMIPSAASAMSTGDFLDIANEELQSFLVNTLTSVNEEYFVAKDPVDYSITSGTAAYAIPERAIDASVRSVQISTDGVNWNALPRIEPTRTPDFNAPGSPAAYKIEGNNIVLVPTPNATQGTLRIKYAARPHRLVATTSVAEIASVDTGTKTVTTAGTVPSAFSPSVTFDILKGGPHFDTQAMDQTATVASGTTITFSSALPSGLQKGDFVALAGEGPIPQIPISLHHVLALKVVATYLFAVGEAGLAQAAEAMCERKRKDAVGRMSPRTAGSRATS
jgi:hypothetical protein